MVNYLDLIVLHGRASEVTSVRVDMKSEIFTSEPNSSINNTIFTPGERWLSKNVYVHGELNW